tara:strand:- start:586 stop:936 length:351 start_codon:yes stop_codon:yes gene_type:complete
MQKKIPIKFIKYEDLQNQTYIVFKEIIKFINEITNNKEKINIDKIKTVLKTTSFEKLKKNETDHGFSEAMTTREDKNKKIPFFNLGPQNDWKKIISDDLKIKLESIFDKDLKELSY